jgi:hypothetical protein
MVLREGDVVAGVGADGRVKVMKIIKINFVEGDRILHVQAYKEIFRSLDAAAAAFKKKARLTIDVLHIPVDAEGMAPDANRILGNVPVTEAEKAVYKEYLREMGP